MLSAVAVGMLWLYIFDPRYGLLATLVRAVGIESPQWYTSKPWGLVMLIIVYLGKHVGYVALIYLAGLQAIPEDLREAAAMDGASAMCTFRSIILPLLGPVTFFLLVTMTLSSLPSFDLIDSMIGGGPLGSTTTLMYHIYLDGFETGRAGEASASATILFLSWLVITGLQLPGCTRRVGGRRRDVRAARPAVPHDDEDAPGDQLRWATNAPVTAHRAPRVAGEGAAVSP